MGGQKIGPDDGFGGVGDNECPGAGSSAIVHVDIFGTEYGDAASVCGCESSFFRFGAWFFERSW